MRSFADLNSNERLVYVKNTLPLSDVDGYTQLAKIIRKIPGSRWYEMLLLTGERGNYLENPIPTNFHESSFVSDRSIYPIVPARFYYYLPLDGEVAAIGYAIKSKQNPLENTTNVGLGSGIYGRYIDESEDPRDYVSHKGQQIYTIESPEAYPLQDKEHGESLTMASLQTNLYMDTILEFVTSKNWHSERVDLRSAIAIIKSESTQNLVTLWNMVFYRAGGAISKDWLDDVLAEYVVRYFSRDPLLDSNTKEEIIELPINDIMTGLGYRGIIASDVDNNINRRGCVSYKLPEDAKTLGSNSYY